MHKIIITMVMASMLALSSMAHGQKAEQDQKTTTDLNAELAATLARLAASETKDGEFTSKFSGFGREMGKAMNGFVEAMDGGMKVTTERVNEFAKTDVGKYAMIGIGWKIFASDILAMVESCFSKVTGVFLMLVFICLLRYGVRLFFVGKMIVTKKEGPWYAKNVVKERMQPIYAQLARASVDQQVVAGWLGTIFLLALVVLFTVAIVLIA